MTTQSIGASAQHQYTPDFDPSEGTGTGRDEAYSGSTEDRFETASTTNLLARQSDGDARSRFAEQFQKLAQDPEAFHALMRESFGDGYDQATAESFRQKAFAGDTSWMPNVRFVSAESMGAGLGAYDSESNTIFLSLELEPNPALLDQVFAEEFGHFLDHQLNATDSAGDEGEMFRRLLAGEALSATQIHEIRTENDHGTIRVDGEEIEVEFFFKKLKKAFKSVGKALKKAGKQAVAGIKTLGTGLLNAAKGVAENALEGAKTFGSGFSKLFSGDFKGAFRDWGSGLGKVFLQTPIDTTLMMAGTGISAIQTTLGIEPIGRKLTTDEIAALREVYGDSIDYSKVRIKEGKAGIFGLSSDAFVLGDTIYMQDKTVTTELLIHEMAHVWQHQNGGTDYLSEALWSQSQGKGYDWAQSVPNTPWSGLEPEQQAQFLEAAAQAGAFDPSSANYGTFSFDVDGDGVAEDLTVYLQAALAQIQAGQGAP